MTIELDSSCGAILPTQSRREDQVNERAVLYATVEVSSPRISC